MSVITGDTGAVYDRGYRPYEGPRGRSRGAATFALYKASIRRALGIRRPWRQKVAPFVLLGVVTIPAIVNVGIGYVTHRSPRRQARDHHLSRLRRGVVGAAAVRCTGRTRRDVPRPSAARVLPLMFARPLTGIDYVVAKVGAIASILFAFSFLPQVVLFVGNMLVSDSAYTYFTGHLDVLWKVPLSVGILAIYYAIIGVTVASLTDRRIVAGAGIIGLLLVTSIASGIIVGDFEAGHGSIAGLINIWVLPLYLKDIVFLGNVDPQSPLSGVANAGLYALVLYLVILLVGSGVLLYRYRWVER